MQRSSKSLTLLASFLLAATAALAQRDTAAVEGRPGTFGDVVDVRVINLEVVVTDPSGTRVDGLGPSDFVLTVDGNEVPIEYFTEVLGGRAVVPDPSAEFLILPALAPGEPVGRSFLVFLDEFFSRPEDLQRVLTGLLDQLPLLEPEDRMAVVAYDGHELQMLTSWSQSVEELVRTVQRARLRPTFGRQRELQVAALDVIDRLGLDEFRLGDTLEQTTEFDPEELQQMQLVSNQVRRVVAAATGALRSFAQPPGRKVMLIYSGGWPTNVVRWVAEDPRRTVLEGPLSDSDLVAPLVAAANRLNYTLYPIEVKAFDVRSVDVRDTSGSVATLEAFTDRDLSQLERENEEERTLAFMARETGGRAILNADSTEALGRVSDDTRSYYWLGFTPSWKGDGSSHDVGLAMRDASRYRIRSRRNFSDLSRSAEVDMMVESALLFGSAPSDEPLTVELGEAEGKGMSRMQVPVQIFVPVGSLTFIPQGESWVAQAELRVAVLDERGNTLEEIPVIPLNFAIDEPPGEGENARYDTRIQLRKIRHDVVVSLYDQISGKMRSTRLEVAP